jgi:hypothetical protein
MSTNRSRFGHRTWLSPPHPSRRQCKPLPLYRHYQSQSKPRRQFHCRTRDSFPRPMRIRIRGSRCRMWHCNQVVPNHHWHKWTSHKLHWRRNRSHQGHSTLHSNHHCPCRPTRTTDKRLRRPFVPYWYRSSSLADQSTVLHSPSWLGPLDKCRESVHWATCRHCNTPHRQ